LITEPVFFFYKNPKAFVEGSVMLTPGWPMLYLHHSINQSITYHEHILAILAIILTIANV